MENVRKFRKNIFWRTFLFLISNIFFPIKKKSQDLTFNFLCLVELQKNKQKKIKKYLSNSYEKFTLSFSFHIFLISIYQCGALPLGVHGLRRWHAKESLPTCSSVVFHFSVQNTVFWFFLSCSCLHRNNFYCFNGAIFLSCIFFPQANTHMNATSEHVETQPTLRVNLADAI